MRLHTNHTLTEAEFIALVTLAEKLVDRLLDPTRSRPLASAPVFVHAPDPAPASPVPDVDERMAAEDAREAEETARIERGTHAWAPVVRTWATNFEVEGVPQPDRAGALMAVFSGHSRAVAAYIRERGGLAGATIDTLARENIVTPDVAAAVGKRIALNMVQVGTAIGLPLDHLIERSLLAREAPDTLPLDGGLLGDTVDMTRPEYDRK
jgi:hypothetical protein